jgi:protein phosphatase
MVTVRAAAVTDVGRVRALNEDSHLTGGDLFVVADGMGGHAAGDVASELAVQRLSQLAGHPELKPAALREAIAHANREILTAASTDQRRAGMGTTIAGLGVIRFAGSEHWVVFNVGDSRVYKFVDGTLVKLTVDHSEVEEMVVAGTINAEEARTHPQRNVITRALGMDPPPEADVWIFPTESGERFLLCSDGLHSELTDREITAVLRAEPTAKGAAETLVRQAVEAGGRDNVTVIVVDHLVVVDDDDADTARRVA